MQLLKNAGADLLVTDLNMPVLDGSASIVIGIILSLVAVFLGYETRALLVGETISDILRGEIHAIVSDDDTVVTPIEGSPDITIDKALAANADEWKLPVH